MESAVFTRRGSGRENRRLHLGLFNNYTAMRIINSGVAALDRNLFEGSSSSDNNTDLLISATAGTVTLGSNNAFAGDVNYIDNRSTQSFDLTANNTTFDEASPYAIENLVYHKVDDAALGLVRTAAGAIYVTQKSGSIQRGIRRRLDSRRRRCCGSPGDL